ncbi:MAG: acyloxyacyl hydrolase [Nitrospirae bacterium]|nr:MAG: acyloxyacyl hydrolase [Nitrospirota bacterium]
MQQMSTRNNIDCGLFMIPVFLVLVFVSGISAEEEKPAGPHNATSHWGVLGGYGVTHKGFKNTRTKVETVDFVVRRGYFFTEEIGRSWYKGRHEWIFEIPVHYVTNPETAIMTGINLLGCWNLTSSKKVVPYLFAGGGLLYTNLNVPELGAEFNGNYQAGAGIHYFITGNTSIEFNYRYHHISNAGTAKPNDPLNSSKVMVGISFFR